ncbi:hypothetical protein AVEN_180157-1 [Araneus ventricosus]|uniref:Uncharacterized protein n=1 Tax=Araneus ventricosus TaxID=182803 RepID=A0A4Y2D4L4_ARAVE|nr:hypothetical protein AVEN_180157-1 [Araneus ventricosus]
MQKIHKFTNSDVTIKAAVPWHIRETESTTARDDRYLAILTRYTEPFLLGNSLDSSQLPLDEFYRVKPNCEYLMKFTYMRGDP